MRVALLPGRMLRIWRVLRLFSRSDSKAFPQSPLLLPLLFFPLLHLLSTTLMSMWKTSLGLSSLQLLLLVLLPSARLERAESLPLVSSPPPPPASPLVPPVLLSTSLVLSLPLSSSLRPLFAISRPLASSPPASSLSSLVSGKRQVLLPPFLLPPFLLLSAPAAPGSACRGIVASAAGASSSTSSILSSFSLFSLSTSFFLSFNSARALQIFSSPPPLPQRAFSWQKFRAFLGPGWIVAMGFLDPGNLEGDLQAGSRRRRKNLSSSSSSSSFFFSSSSSPVDDTGYSLLWVILWGHVGGWIFQVLAARLGNVTGKDLAT